MVQRMQFWENIPMEARPGVRYWVPAAAMDEMDLREEIRQLYARGFGRIELVVLSGRNRVLDESEDGWGKANWNKMVRIAADETEKLGMKLDIANGPGWPISSPVIKNADHPAALRELTYGELCLEAGTHYDGPLPERKTIRPEGTPKLVALMAYPCVEEGVLQKEGYIDLISSVSQDGTRMCFDLPGSGKTGMSRQYRVFAFYEQPAAQKVNSNMYYVIDHLSRAGVKACEEYWKPIFGEYSYPSMESFFCDSLEYAVTLEWTPGFEDFFAEKYGYDIRPFLPTIGQHAQVLSAPEVPGYRFEDRTISEMVNREFMEALTFCYTENHLRGLEEMANSFGKTIRYQVAYNKPFEEEISALYPGIPENEALGRPTLDGQKTMAAAAHLGRKKRYSFECAAEFGFGYNQTYEDLMWWVKRALMAGMNAEVLHGASYSGAYYGKLSENGRVPGSKWPGYEGFGRFVSNNWNRTLSVPDARHCLDTIARMNAVFLETAKVDCAILRSSYVNTGEGAEFNFYGDDGRLSKAGYSYEFVTENLLSLPVCEVRCGELDPEGPGYRAIIVMSDNELSLQGVRKLRALLDAGLPVIFLAERYACRYYSDWKDDARRKAFETELHQLIAEAKKRGFLASMATVAETLRHVGIQPRAALFAKHDMITATREAQSQRFYAVYSYNRIGFDPYEQEMVMGTTHSSGRFRTETQKSRYEKPGEKSREMLKVSLEAPEGGTVFLLDPWRGTEEVLDFTFEKGRLTGIVGIEEDEMLLFSVRKKTSGTVAPDRFHRSVQEEIPICFDTLRLYAFKPDTEEEVSFLRSHFLPEGKTYAIDGPAAFSEIDPALEHFAGKGVYSGTFQLTFHEDNHYILKLGIISDTFTLRINGREVPGCDQVFRRVDISDYVRNGDNSIEVSIVTNLNACLTESFAPERFQGLPFGMPSLDHRYGMWKSPDFPVGIFAER